MLDTNVLGTLVASRAFVALLGADQALSVAKGGIINITSIAGKIGQPFAGAYVASKFALEGLSEVMRRELNLSGIGVVMVAPATVENAIGSYAPTDYSDAFAKDVGSIVDAGHRHSLQTKDFAETVMKALGTRRPRLRYAPARHALLLLEQTLPRITPKRLTGVAIEHALGLKPNSEKLLKGISV